MKKWHSTGNVSSSKSSLLSDFSKKMKHMGWATIKKKTFHLPTQEEPTLEECDEGDVHLECSSPGGHCQSDCDTCWLSSRLQACHATLPRVKRVKVVDREPVKDKGSRMKLPFLAKLKMRVSQIKRSTRRRLNKSASESVSPDAYEVSQYNCSPKFSRHHSSPSRLCFASYIPPLSVSSLDQIDEGRLESIQESLSESPTESFFSCTDSPEESNQTNRLSHHSSNDAVFTNSLSSASSLSFSASSCDLSSTTDDAFAPLITKKNSSAFPFVLFGKSKSSKKGSLSAISPNSLFKKSTKTQPQQVLKKARKLCLSHAEDSSMPVCQSTSDSVDRCTGHAPGCSEDWHAEKNANYTSVPCYVTYELARASDKVAKTMKGAFLRRCFSLCSVSPELRNIKSKQHSLSSDCIRLIGTIAQDGHQSQVGGQSDFDGFNDASDQTCSCTTTRRWWNSQKHGRFKCRPDCQSKHGGAKQIRDSSYDRAVKEDRGSRAHFSLGPDEHPNGVTGDLAKSGLYKKSGLKKVLRARSISRTDKKKACPSPRMPVTNGTSNSGENADQNSWSPNTLLVKLKRSMSLSRLTGRRSQERLEDLNGSVSDLRTHHPSFSLHKFQPSPSCESLTSVVGQVPNIDLGSGDVRIRPVHPSMTGQDNVFEVSTGSSTVLYACTNRNEMNQWANNLRKTVNPGEDQTRRTDTSLKLWIQEAKNVSSKKRYFVEMALDKTAYGRTTSKTKTDMLFWGEHFDFSHLPKFSSLTLNLYKEPEKKKKRDRSLHVGYVIIPVEDLKNRQISEKWHTLSTATVGKSGKESKSDLPQLRVKLRYQVVDILPLSAYTRLLSYLKENYLELVTKLEPIVNVRAKEDIAFSLTCVLESEGLAKDFLCDIIMSEVQKQDNKHLTFRGNTIGTKAIESYMKLVGGQYLTDTLGAFVNAVLGSEKDCEVDPSKITNNSFLQRQQSNLIEYCKDVWQLIYHSASTFPSELTKVFSEFRQSSKAGEGSNCLISACVFLRFLCPAILSPSLFGLCREFPDDQAARNLTLIAKTLQSLANFSKFGSKEEYMIFMNAFVDKEWQFMQDFLEDISTVDGKPEQTQYNGHIDNSLHLALLHSLLSENLLPGQSSTTTTSVTTASTALTTQAKKEDADRFAQLLSILQTISNEYECTPLLQKPKLLKSMTDNNMLRPAEVEVQLLRKHSATPSVSSTLARSVAGSSEAAADLESSSGTGSSSVSAPKKARPESDEYVEFTASAMTRYGYGSQTVLTADTRVESPRSTGQCHPRLSVSSNRPMETMSSTCAMSTISSGQSEPNVQQGSVDGSSDQLSTTSSLSRKPFMQTMPARTSSLNAAGAVHSSTDSGDGLMEVSPAASQESSPSAAAANKSRSSNSSRKVLVQRVWDRTLTANDFVNGDYVDLISYYDEEEDKASVVSSGVVSSATTLSSTGHGTPGRGSPAFPGAGDADGGAKKQPLSFVNPTFNKPRGAVGRRGSENALLQSPIASPHKEEFQPLPNKSVRENRAKNANNNNNSNGAATVNESFKEALALFAKHDAKSQELLAGRDGKRPGPGRFPTEDLHLSRDYYMPSSASLMRRHGGEMSRVEMGRGEGQQSCDGMEGHVTPSSWSSQSSINSGIRSIQRKIDERQKIKVERERDVEALKAQLEHAQLLLSATEGKIAENVVKTETAINEWQQKFEESEQRLMAQQIEKDQQIFNIAERLQAIEKDLKQEQQTMKNMITDKQRTIENQEEVIRKLDVENNQLLGKLQERVNHSSEAKPQTTYKTTLYYNDFKKPGVY